MKFSGRTWIWLSITLVFMIFIYYKSDEPYQRQDIKPYLKEHIQLSEHQLPNINFYYDGDHVTSNKPYDLIEFLIRKMGHVSEYALLCFLFIQTARSAAILIGRSLLIAGFLSFLYSCTDEWHQSFVSGRTGHPIDVFVPDLTGIMLIIVIYWLFVSIRRGSSL